jgi:hypothetical protein
MNKETLNRLEYLRRRFNFNYSIDSDNGITYYYFDDPDTADFVLLHFLFDSPKELKHKLTTTIDYMYMEYEQSDIQTN